MSRDGRGLGVFVVICKMTFLPSLSLKRKNSNCEKLFNYLFMTEKNDYRPHNIFILDNYKPHREMKIESLAHFARGSLASSRVLVGGIVLLILPPLCSLLSVGTHS